MSIKRLREVDGAAGNDGREENREKALDDTFVDLFEESDLIVRGSRTRMFLSPILDIFLDEVRTYKLLNDDDIETTSII